MPKYKINLVNELRRLLSSYGEFASYNKSEREDPESGYAAFVARLREFEDTLDGLQCWIEQVPDEF